MTTTSGSVRPNFVGVGVPRAGTTWIHRVINSHPLGFTPQARKEVHFFDRHFERGTEWYLRFFETADPTHLAVGEFTPHYFYSQLALERIRRFDIPTALVCLRNPTERLWSNYQFKKRQDGFVGSLEEFLAMYPEMMRWSEYDRHIESWIDSFGDAFHVLVYETISGSDQALQLALFDALKLPIAGFPEQVVRDRVNATMMPKRAGLYRRLVRANKWLVDRDLDRVAGALKRVPGGMAFAGASANQDETQMMTASERTMLAERFDSSIARLASLTGADLSHWTEAP